MSLYTSPFRVALLCVLAVACTGCISTGETIRVSGEVVDAQGNRLTNAIVTAEGGKRGGTIVSGDRTDEADESREATVTLPGDGTFTASSRWAGRLTIAVKGYKIRRVDDLGTEFLVPNRSFYQSENQARLEVVKDE